MDKPIVMQSNVNLLINKYEREKNGETDDSQDDIVVTNNWDSDNDIISKKNKSMPKNQKSEHTERSKDKDNIKEMRQKFLKKTESFSNINNNNKNDKQKDLIAAMHSSIIEFNDRIWINSNNSDNRLRRLKNLKKENWKISKFTSNNVEWIKKEFKTVVTEEN
jgi:hypothetical protein